MPGGWWWWWFEKERKRCEQCDKYLSIHLLRLLLVASCIVLAWGGACLCLVWQEESLQPTALLAKKARVSSPTSRVESVTQ